MLGIHSSARMAMVPGVIATRPVISQEQEQHAVPLAENEQNFFSRIPIELMVNIYRYLPNLNQLFQLMLVNCTSFDAVQQLLLTNSSAKKLWNHRGIKEILKSPDAEKNIGNIKIAIENMQHVYFRIGEQSSFNNIEFERTIEILDCIEKNKNIESLCLIVYFINLSNSDDILNKIIKILKNCHNLKEIELNFDGNIFSTEQMIKLVGAFNKSICKFSSSRNFIESDGAEKIIPYLKETSISELLLEGANLNGKGLEHLKELPLSVKRLSLSNNEINSQDISYLKDALSKNIVELRLSFNNIGDIGVKILCGLLKHDLISLSLLDNSISNRGVEYLACLLKSNIHTLILSHNNINNDGVKFILKILEKGLKRLKLTSSYISMYGISQILKSLNNTDIEHLDLRHSKKIKDEQIKFLIEKMPEIDMECIDMSTNKLTTVRKKGYINKNGKLINILLSSDQFPENYDDNLYYLSSQK